MLAAERMTATLCMLPSPLLGPAVWQSTVDTLTRRGWAVATTRAVKAAPRTPLDVVDWFLEALPTGSDLILIPHSNAGLYVPALTQHRQIAGHVFVDAGLPPGGGRIPLAQASMSGFLDQLTDSNSLLPPWTAWWAAADVGELFPDASTRASVEREQHRLPRSYFASTLPVPPGWDASPGAYLAFGETYASDKQGAARRGWPVVTLPGRHLHMLWQPELVAATIEDLLEKAGLYETGRARRTSRDER